MINSYHLSLSTRLTAHILLILNLVFMKDLLFAWYVLVPLCTVASVVIMLVLIAIYEFLKDLFRGS